MDFSRDYYEILGLDNKATSDDIKKTYREMAKKYHPDINKSSTSEELFKLISEAYEVLSDDTKRAQYDLYRKLEYGEEDGAGTEEESAPTTEVGLTPVDSTKVPDTKVKRPVKIKRPAEHSAPVQEKDYRQLLVLTLIVPGYYQIIAGEKKLGYMIFVIYFIFWALAFTLSLPIGILAIIVWLYSFYDAYSHTGKNKPGVHV